MARTAVTQAAAEFHGFGGEDAIGGCARSVAALDAVVARLHRQLQQPAGEPPAVTGGER